MTTSQQGARAAVIVRFADVPLDMSKESAHLLDALRLKEIDGAVHKRLLLHWAGNSLVHGLARKLAEIHGATDAEFRLRAVLARAKTIWRHNQRVLRKRGQIREHPAFEAP